MLQDDLRAVGASDPEFCGVASREKELWRNALCAPYLTGRAAEHGYEQGSGETRANAMRGSTHMPSSPAVLPPNGSRLSCGAYSESSQTQFYFDKTAPPASVACEADAPATLSTWADIG